VKSRNYVPCRICKKAHTNSRSSSICETCGPIEALTNGHARGYQSREDRRIEADRAITKQSRFEAATTVDELKAWIQEYMI
jgi:hypothetical protein